MIIHFKLAWLKPGAAPLKAFKTRPAFDLFQDYAQRISRFSECKVTSLEKDFSAPGQGMKRWICDRSAGSEMPASEALAKKIQTLERSGVRELQILIGGPDGFPAEDLRKLVPDMRWCFGPLTFPHELAAIIAGEQIYRAFTILHNHPYHQGH